MTVDNKLKDLERRSGIHDDWFTLIIAKRGHAPSQEQVDAECARVLKETGQRPMVLQWDGEKWLE